MAPVKPVGPVDPVEPVAPVEPVEPAGSGPAVPDNAVDGLAGASVDAVSVAVRAPWACGEKRMSTMQLEPGESAPPQSSPEVKKSPGLAPEIAKPETISGAEPLLVIVAD